MKFKTSGKIEATSLNTSGNVDIDGCLDVEGSTILNALTINASQVIDMGNNKITNVAGPTLAQDVTTKGYVDGLVSGLNIKESCRAATTGNLNIGSGSPGQITITIEDGHGKCTPPEGEEPQGGFDATNNTFTVDGVSLIEGDRLLIKDNVIGMPRFNGIWVVGSLETANAWVPLYLTRALDFNDNSDVGPGAYTFIEDGAVNKNKGYVLTSTANITFSSATDITFSQFSGAGQIDAGAGLVMNNAQMSLDSSLTGVTSITNTILHVGRKDSNKIIFADPGSITFRVGGNDGVRFLESGKIETEYLEVSNSLYINGYCALGSSLISKLQIDLSLFLKNS